MLIYLSLLSLSLLASSEPNIPQHHALGASHSCAVLGNQAKCWGSNTYGKLGYQGPDSLIPVPVVGLSSNVTSLAVSPYHTCAVDGGVVKCWGRNNMGQLGNGTLTNSSEPVNVMGLPPLAQKVVSGQFFSCAMFTREVWCWGYLPNFKGALFDPPAYGTTGTLVVRSSDVPIGGRIMDIVAGFSHACARVDNGAGKYSLGCWGDNDYGKLGIGNFTDSFRMKSVYLSGVTALAAGAHHTCAVKDGVATCWGNDYYGQVGDGAGTGYSYPSPRPVLGLAKPVTEISAASETTCAISNSQLYCWGFNLNSLLADGDTTLPKIPSPARVANLGANIRGIKAGYNHRCVESDMSLLCWGRNNMGTIGDGTTIDRWTPVEVTLAE